MQIKQADILMQGLFPPDVPGAALAILLGKRYFSRGYGLADLDAGVPISSDTDFRIASLTKQFTARAIHLLQSQEGLSLQEPISQYFPAFPVALGQITPWQLLHHSSGIADYEALLPPGRTEPLGDRDVEALITAKGFLYFPPGTAFRYSNTGYCLLARLLEKASGRPFRRYIEQHIFTPLAMTHSRVFQPDMPIPNRAYGYHRSESQWHWADQDVTSTTQGDGGIYTSANDFSKWIIAGREWRIAARRPAHPPFPGVLHESVWYQDGWFASEEADGSPCWFHSGESTGFRHVAYCNDARELAIFLFSNGDDNRVDEAFSALTDIFSLSPAVGAGEFSLCRWLHQVYQAGSG
jgi:CubicO group peptidase (beta-lactamase class C family)